jgi:alkylhydroperoxidase/carboxymuconolactone decarboxylase family protein YurZ
MQGHPGAIWHEHSVIPAEAGIQAGWCDDNEINASLRRHDDSRERNDVERPPCNSFSADDRKLMNTSWLNSFTQSGKTLGDIMAQNAKDAFEKTSLGAQNKAYDLIAQMDPEYFDKLKGLYVDGTFGREGALPRKTKELIMVGICCALNRPRGVKLHSERALTLGVSAREVLEAVEVAAIPGGMPGLWLGVETLNDILKAKGIEFK